MLIRKYDLRFNPIS